MAGKDSVSSASLHRWRTNVLLLCIGLLAGYMMFFNSLDVNAGGITDSMMEELEQELDGGNPVRHVSYHSPLDENLFKPWRAAILGSLKEGEDDQGVEVQSRPVGRAGRRQAAGTAAEESPSARAARYHKIWTRADKLITDEHLWPADSSDVDKITEALASARIVNVDVLDIGEYESGTASKWIAILEGGQKAVLKIIWEEKGSMKRGALCNFGFESPTSEIAAFHLHRILGFNNTPYVSGRKVDLLKEILPVATASVAKQIIIKQGNVTCVKAKCFHCKVTHTMCPRGGVVEVSVAYWVSRRLQLHTYPVKYMPYSTPRMDEWGGLSFNNRTYCNKVRETLNPYNQAADYFYNDIFDFAVIDTIMYHYDSKHYTINDGSEANGLTVRLDHGRAFCAHDRDDEHVFLAPLQQCCTLRAVTYNNLMAVHGVRSGGVGTVEGVVGVGEGELTRRLRASLDKDPIAPVLDPVWYPTLERRLSLILDLVERCITVNGRDKVLVTDSEL